MNEKDCFLDTLRELLIRNNFTIQSFSKAIGINRRTVTWWFHSRSPRLDSLIKVARFFNCSIDYLIGKTDDASYRPSSYEAGFFARYQELKSKRGLTDYRVSDICNIRTSTISKWKNGVIPEFEILVKLSKLFDCCFDYLVGCVN